MEGFIEALQRWVERESPPQDVYRATVGWVLRDLADDPYPPLSRPVGDGFPVTWWFAQTPFGRDERSRVVCLYEINARALVLRAHLIDELSLPII